MPIAAPAVVLDTNVVLDWLVFRHPSSQPLADAITSGSVAWIANASTRAELAHVLGRGHLAQWQPDESALWRTWDRFALMRDARSPTGAALRLRCTDPDDQKFVDLASAHGARWLLSRDRAVLKLARRALPLGLHVLTPERWSLPASAT